MTGAGVAQEENTKSVVGEKNDCGECAYVPPCVLCSFFDKENLVTVSYQTSKRNEIGTAYRLRGFTQRRDA